MQQDVLPGAGAELLGQSAVEDDLVAARHLAEPARRGQLPEPPIHPQQYDGVGAGGSRVVVGDAAQHQHRRCRRAEVRGDPVGQVVAKESVPTEHGEMDPAQPRQRHPAE